MLLESLGIPTNIGIPYRCSPANAMHQLQGLANLYLSQPKVDFYKPTSDEKQVCARHIKPGTHEGVSIHIIRCSVYT